ncbi:MAG TPA: alpha-amylase family glycosyl hydrolase, partial [Gemmatimonadales bacterium]|nr:alpha-amylase family glycosyl hydrolase [Gemmatimonadales bacterium]
MTATYRLQLRPGFGFDEARAILPYLRRLGISHVYLSPITDARRGSTHGYDVVDHTRIREELGGPEDFGRLVDALREIGLRLIIDFVPNHGSVGARNARWQDVLAHGRASRFARFFDIDWDSRVPDLRGKVLLPFLGRPYGEALDAGEITLAEEDGRWSAAYHRDRFALAPETWEEAAALAAGGRPSREALHALLERQYWRLAFWKTAVSEINYRRFFDVNELVALRMEDPEVFEATHTLLADLVRLDVVDGVRIDHVDGLYDPFGYLTALRALGPRQVWVEKILAPGEMLPGGWPVEGTTGYDFMHEVTA